MGRSEIDGGKIGGSPPTPEGMRIKFGERVTEEDCCRAGGGGATEEGFR
jgi:hypothetical protein